MRLPVLLVLSLSVLAGCQSSTGAKDEEDPAGEILAAIEAIKVPVLNASGDPQIYQAKYEQAWMERAPLVRKLALEHPDDPRTAKLMDEYWQSLMRTEMSIAECDRVIAEIDAVRKNSTNAQLRQHGAFWTTFYASYRDKEEIDKVIAYADAFAAEFPHDPRGATIYSFASMSGLATKEQMAYAFESLIEKYSKTEDGAFARAMLPLLENVGKPFEFDFDDAVTGTRYRHTDFRGKIIVVDWWATWCGPCIQSLPRMKELQEKYKPKGVEFIGVSLDKSAAEGGLKALRDFVKQNDMSWPQYHLNADPTFQQRYRVAQIPTVFVVDREGKIASIDGYRTLERTLEAMAAS